MLPAKLKLVRVTIVYILTILTLNGKSMAVDSADCSRGTKTGGLKRLTGELVCSEPSPPLVPLGSLCTPRRGSLCLRTHQTSSGSFLGGGKGSWTATRRSAVPITGQTSSYLQYMNKVQLLCRNRQISAMTERIQNKHSKKRSPISREISHQLTIRTSFRRGNTNHDSYGNMVYSFSSINSCFTPVVFFCSWLSGMQSFVAVWLMSTSDTWLNLYSKCKIILATTKNQDKKKKIIIIIIKKR